MNTVVGLFCEQSGVERAVEELRRVGVPEASIRFVTRDSNLGVDLSGAGGGHIFNAELERGGTLVVVEAPENLAHETEVALRKAGVDDMVTHDDAAAGNWAGTREGGSTGRSYEHAAGVAGRDRAEGSERNNWNEAEKLAYGTDMGEGAAQGGTMGAPLGAGTTLAAGGPMGETPGDHPADDAAAGVPNPDRQADIERQRRSSDPAP
jgi:hypothetical protein